MTNNELKILNKMKSEAKRKRDVCHKAHNLIYAGYWAMRYSTLLTFQRLCTKEKNNGHNI